MTRWSRAGIVGALVWSLAVLGGCGEGREFVTRSSALYTYVDDIQPILNSKCVPCHGAQKADGGYRLDTWPALLGGASTVQTTAAASQAANRLLSAISRPSHQSVISLEEANMLKHWIVDDQLAYSRSDYHPEGWLDPRDRNATTFHGGAMRASGWDFAGCKQCHGADLAGMGAAVSCLTCHSDGPETGCSTCHGGPSGGGVSSAALPWKGLGSVGAASSIHQVHINPRSAEPLDCNECHRVPNALADAGHLFDDTWGQQSDLRAEVTFGHRARLKGVAPVYNPGTKTCTAYCHGAAFSFTGGTPGTAAVRTQCDGCHNVAAHGKGTDCSACHRQSVAKCTPGTADCLEVVSGVGVRFLAKVLHMDGKAPVGQLTGDLPCHGCHGTQESGGAPAPDLRGNTSTDIVTVGMHQAHVTSSRFRVAIPCQTCHVTPSYLDAPGHIDSGLPAEVRFNDLATGRLRNPDRVMEARWDRQAGTCTNVYCHAVAGGAVGEVWSWTKRVPGGLHCQSCHRGKPEYSFHYCKTCHLSAYKDGALDPATHVNGKLDWSQ